MSRRTGIDLSAARCTVVDASLTSRWRKHGERSQVRVRNFATLGRADNDQALTAQLKLLAESGRFSRHAWVTLWDVRSTHQYVQLPVERKNQIGAIARQHGASVLGLDTRDLTIGVAHRSSTRFEARQKLERSFFAASSEDIQNKLRPIEAAGFVVEGVSTPCGALWAQARLRLSAVPGEVHAYIALRAAMSALVIVSDGFLLYARELNWGYLESPVGPPRPRSRDEIAARLAPELKRSFLYLKQYWEEDVSQVLLCGDMPEIRSLTAPLIERLNIEVETLDTLDGIDTAALPEPVDQFTDQVASFRLAAAIAAEPPPVNLLPLEITTHRVNRTGQIVFAAGSAAAVAFGAFLYGQANMRAQNAQHTVAALQQQVAAMEPRVRAIDVARQDAGVETAQQAALNAFDTQGPRMARILEALAEVTPREIALKSIRAVPDGVAWRVAIEAITPSTDPVRARLSVDSFLRRLEESALFGRPVRAPVQRMAPGASDLEITAEYSVRK